MNTIMPLTIPSRPFQARLRQLAITSAVAMASFLVACASGPPPDLTKISNAIEDWTSLTGCGADGVFVEDEQKARFVAGGLYRIQAKERDMKIDLDGDLYRELPEGMDVFAQVADGTRFEIHQNGSGGGACVYFSNPDDRTRRLADIKNSIRDWTSRAGCGLDGVYVSSGSKATFVAGGMYRLYGTGYDMTLDIDGRPSIYLPEKVDGYVEVRGGESFRLRIPFWHSGGACIYRSSPEDRDSRIAQHVSNTKQTSDAITHWTKRADCGTHGVFVEDEQKSAFIVGGEYRIVARDKDMKLDLDGSFHANLPQNENFVITVNHGTGFQIHEWFDEGGACIYLVSVRE